MGLWMMREYGAKKNEAYQYYHYYLELSTFPAKYPLQAADAHAQLWACVPGLLL